MILQNSCFKNSNKIKSRAVLFAKLQAVRFQVQWKLEKRNSIRDTFINLQLRWVCCETYYVCIKKLVRCKTNASAFPTFKKGQFYRNYHKLKLMFAVLHYRELARASFLSIFYKMQFYNVLSVIGSPDIDNQVGGSMKNYLLYLLTFFKRRPKDVLKTHRGDVCRVTFFQALRVSVWLSHFDITIMTLHTT